MHISLYKDLNIQNIINLIVLELFSMFNLFLKLCVLQIYIYIEKNTFIVLLRLLYVQYMDTIVNNINKQ
jgi:hypothetical protein